MLTYANSIPDDDAPAQVKTLPSYHGPPDPNVEKLTDRNYTPARSRMVDRWLEYREMEGF
jgi:hypothetical protein